MGTVIRLRTIVGLVVFLLSISCQYAVGQTLKIIHIDVGQGDATLIIGPTGKTLLFDSGPTGSGTKLKQIMDANSLTSLDYFVAGHYHADHIGAIDELLAAGIPLMIASYDRGGSYSTQAYTDYVTAVGVKRTTLSLGQVIDLGGGVTLEAVAVDGRTPGGVVSVKGSDGVVDENARSISLFVLRYGTFDYLISSDLTGGGITGGVTKPDIESKVAAYVGDVDLVHINHHGSNTSTNAFWVSTLKAEQSVISMGDNNPYGHPTQATLDRLTNSSNMINIWQTTTGKGGTSSKVRVGGDITFTTDGHAYAVTATGYNLTYLTDGVTKVQDFSISLTPTSQTISTKAAGVASFTINITRTGGFSPPLNLTISNLPTGTSATFTPNPVSATSSILTLFVRSLTRKGTYPFTVTATGGSPLLTHTATATLIKSQ